jgi:hypothetical protein
VAGGTIRLITMNRAVLAFSFHAFAAFTSIPFRINPL